MQHYHKLVYQVAALTGRLIAGPRLNTVTMQRTADATTYRKRRYWYASTLIRIAFLRKARFRVLDTTAWHVWEPAVYQQVYQQHVTITNDGALILPAMPGRTLADIVSHPIDLADALAAIAAAIRALARLHQHVILLPDGTACRFSHGDATIFNVTYDVTSDTAFWFDFETAHEPARQHLWRCADDLRALLFSAVARLGIVHIATVAKLVNIEYPDVQVQRALREVVLQLRQQPDAWHLAQTHMPYYLHQALCEVLIE